MSVYRLQFDTRKRGGEFLVDADTRKAPVFNDEITHVLRFGFFDGNRPVDMEEITAVRVQFLYGAGAVLLDAKVDLPLASTSVSLSSWNAGRGHNFEVEVAREDMDYAFGAGQNALPIYIVVTGDVGEEVTRLLGKGSATLARNFDAPAHGGRAGSGTSSPYLPNSVLAADDGGTVAARQLSPDSTFGRSGSAAPSAIPRATGAHLQGTGTALRAWAAGDIAAVANYRISQNSTIVRKEDFSTHSVLASSATPGVTSSRPVGFGQILGRQNLAGAVIEGIPQASPVELAAEEPTALLRGLSPANVKTLIAKHGAVITLDEETIYGRQVGGQRGQIARVSSGEITEGTENELRAFAPADIKTAFAEYATQSSMEVGPQHRWLWVPAGAITPALIGGIDVLTAQHGAATYDTLFAKVSEHRGCFTVTLPPEWNRGPIGAQVYWLGNSGDRKEWSVRGLAVSDAQNLTGAAYGATTILTQTRIGTGNLFATSIGSVALGGTPVGDGALVVLEVSAAGAEGTAILGVRLRYTVTEPYRAWPRWLRFTDGDLPAPGAQFWVRTVPAACRVVRAALSVSEWLGGSGEEPVVATLRLNGLTQVTFTIQVADAFDLHSGLDIALVAGDRLDMLFVSGSGAHGLELELWMRH